MKCEFLLTKYSHSNHVSSSDATVQARALIVVVDWMEARMLTSLTALLSERNMARKGQKAASDLNECFKWKGNRLKVFDFRYPQVNVRNVEKMCAGTCLPHLCRTGC